MKHCIAFDRDISVNSCRKAQREIPGGFCEGCSWFKNLYIKKKIYRRGEKVSTKGFLYKVEVPPKLREYLLKTAGQKNISVARLILDILRTASGQTKTQ